MHHFFVEPAVLLSSQTIKLSDAVAHQVRDVLRLAIGEQLVLLDNSGDEVLASIAHISRAGVEVQLQERRPGKRESSVRLVLCQGLLKSARFEWILEKGTELGVSVFVPTLCRRSMAGLEDAGSSKIQRWRRIIQEAAEQCGRSRLPDLMPIRPLMHSLSDIPPDSLALMPWEEERNLSLRNALVAFQHAQDEHSLSDHGAQTTVIVFIGPEGGFTPEEVQLAQRHGVQIVTLGPRILRAETAALTTIANIMHDLELV
jgi:16S rRNA (uracil1498-N3)-methyltransferase